MDFKKESVDSGGGPRAGEARNISCFTSRPVALAPWNLDAVRDIENHGPAERLHDGKAAKINDEIVVAEGSPPFGEDHVAIPGVEDFFQDIPHVPRGEKLPLFDIDGPSGRGGGAD